MIKTHFFLTYVGGLNIGLSPVYAILGMYLVAWVIDSILHL